MLRREFLRSGTAAGLAVAAGAEVCIDTEPGVDASAQTGATVPASASEQHRQRKFKLAYAPHFDMFREHAGQDPLAQLRFMAAEGFTALEDNGMGGRSPEEQQSIAEEMNRLGMRMGVFVAHTIHWSEPSLTNGNAERRQQFLVDVRRSVDVARRVNAKWMTVVPGHVDARMHMEFQTANVIESLKRAAAILEPHGLVMALAACALPSGRARAILATRMKRTSRPILALAMMLLTLVAQARATSCPMGLGATNDVPPELAPATHAHHGTGQPLSPGAAAGSELGPRDSGYPFDPHGHGGASSCALAMSCGPLAAARAPKVSSTVAATVVAQNGPTRTSVSADLSHLTPPPRPIA